MCTQDFITELFCKVDDAMKDVPKHPQASLYPSEVVTLAMLYADKGGSERGFYRWIKRDWLGLFPRLPDRTRLFRLFAAHQDWADRFKADPTVLGVADTFGVELIHPIREGRSARQIGRKGLSNKRWIVGAKLGLVLNKFGLVCAWGCDTANTSDTHFRYLVEPFDQRMIVLTDGGFHGKTGDPPNMKVCEPKTWNCRMVIETVLSMLTRVCGAKRMAHRAWKHLRARLSYTLAAFNVLAQWNGLRPDEHGRIRLSIAEFSL